MSESPLHLAPTELRVLGALMEKELLTPDLYPLSLNGLQAASNQRSSREPVLDLTEPDLRDALATLEQLGLATAARASLSNAGSRVLKFENHARTVLHLRRDEFAILTLLLLRGPQTPGELRSRADRLFSFDDLAAVIATLNRLAEPSPEAATPRPLVAQLPRQPGSREIRYTHLLGDPNSLPTHLPAPQATSAGSLDDLRDAVAALTLRVQQLEEQLGSLPPPSR